MRFHDGSWDLDVMNDYLFSFWVLKRIEDSHKRKSDLQETGIVYSCTCPTFMHYHVCKHVLCAGLHNSLVTVPARFNAEHVGKRKAPAGAKISKRAHCLQCE